jgi:hypothetical protein
MPLSMLGGGVWDCFCSVGHVGVGSSNTCRPSQHEEATTLAATDGHTDFLGGVDGPGVLAGATEVKSDSSEAIRTIAA